MQGFGEPVPLPSYGQQAQAYNAAMPPQANGYGARPSEQHEQQMRAHFENLRAQQQRLGAQHALGLGAPSAQTPAAPPAQLPAQRPAIDPRAFDARLREFHQSRGTPIQGALPLLDGHEVDYARLFQLVFTIGGEALVTSRELWPSILQTLGIPATGPPRVPGGPPTWPEALPSQLAQLYVQVLGGFEAAFRQSTQARNQAAMAGPSGAGAADAAMAQARQRATEAGLNAYSQAQTSPHNLSTQRYRALPPEGSTSQMPPHLRQTSGESAGPRMTNGTSHVQPSPFSQSTALPSIPQPMPPPPPAPPKKRKRLRIDYQPIVRPVEECVVFPITYAEEWDTSVRTRRKPRRVIDLGTVDIHSLTMALRSRIPSEIVYAVNALHMLAEATRAVEHEPGIAFPLVHAPELFEELVELFDDVIEDRLHDTDADAMPPPSPWRTGALPTSHRVFAALAQEDDLRLQADAQKVKVPTAFKRSDLAISLLGLFRHYALQDDNVKLVASSDSILGNLIRLCDFDERPNRTLRLTISELLTIRKDVLEIFNDLALEIRLTQLPGDAGVRALMRLISFFLEPPDPSAPSDQPSFRQHRPYVDLAVAALSKLAVADPARAIIGAALPVRRIRELIDTVMTLLPMTPRDFEAMANEAALVFIESLAMSLYSLVLLAPSDIRQQLRRSAAFGRTVFRIAQRMYAVHPEDFQRNPYAVLVTRCIDILVAVDGRPSATSAAAAAGQHPPATPGAIRAGREKDSDAWFGGAFDGAPDVQGEAEAEKQVGRSAGLDGSAADAPILTSSVFSVVELLANVCVIDTAAFNQLTALCDVMRGRPGRLSL